jgi:drug/metabolite transporter (DMT)-like permease
MAAVFALLSATLGGTADFLGGTLSRRLPSLAVVGASQALGFSLLVVVVMSSRSMQDPGGYAGWAIGSGLFLGLGLASFYSALALGTMGVVAPIAAFGVVVPLSWGLTSGDSPSFVQLLGVVLGVLGIVLASGPEIRGVAGGKPLLLAGLAGVGFGTSMLMAAEGSQFSVIMTASVSKLALFVPFCLLGLLKRTVGGLRPSHAPMIAMIAVCDVGAALSFGFASTRGLVSLVSVIGSLYPVATVLLARYIHGERISALQNVGVVSALCGVGCIALG